MNAHVSPTQAATDLGFIHRFVPGTDPAAAPLLLLHGTGGNEDDLIPLGQSLSPGAALLSPRGQVLENGMPRFFRRLAEGVFDQEDLHARAYGLAGFVEAARARHGLAKPIAVGFSNGANIASALMLLRPGVLGGAILLRAMTPFEPKARPDLTGTPVLMLSGQADPIVTPADREKLAAMLAAAGAQVTHKVLPTGHGLTRADLDLAAGWLAALPRG
jgi:phospholipase/carboxylesterase